MRAPQRFARFEVLGELGKGGQGAVLRARDPATGRDVALKLLLRVDGRSERRFRQEAQVLARLQHPGIVGVLDAGVEDGVPWLAMALVEGESLAARVERHGPLAPAAAARLVADLARAVHHCHERGVVHRDLKPDNVLLERASGRPVLVDFGLLRRDAEVFGALSIDARSRLSRTGELRGTPAYMAPEQVNPTRWGQVGPATDVYALGGVLCFLLTGAPAHEADSLPGLVARILEGVPVDVRARRPDVPAPIAAVCARALARAPADRFPTAAALAEALVTAAAQGPARPRRARARAALALGALALAAPAAWLALTWAPEPPSPPRPPPPSTSPTTPPTTEVLAPRPVETLAGRTGPPTVARRLTVSTPVWRLAARPGAAQVAAGCEDGRVRVWDVDTGDLVHAFDHAPEPRGDRRWVKALAFSPDGAALVSGGADLALRRWDLTGPAPVLAAETRTLEDPCDAAFTPDGARLAIAALDGTVLLLDARALSPLGLVASLGRPHGETVAWDPAGARCLITVTAPGYPTGARWLIVDPEAARTLREARVEEAIAAGVLPPPSADHGWQLRGARFLDAEQVLVGVRNRTTLLLWDLRGAGVPIALEPPEEVNAFEATRRYRGVAGVDVREDLVVTGTHGGLLLGWSLRDRRLRWWTQAHEGPALCAVITPDGRRVVTAGADGELVVWDLPGP